MYTQCPSCGTVYRISTEQLKRAEGEVRCGRCHALFNALLSLSDRLPEVAEADLGTGVYPASGEAPPRKEAAPPVEQAASAGEASEAATPDEPGPDTRRAAPALAGTVARAEVRAGVEMVAPAEPAIEIASTVEPETATAPATRPEIEPAHTVELETETAPATEPEIEPTRAVELETETAPAAEPEIEPARPVELETATVPAAEPEIEPTRAVALETATAPASEPAVEAAPVAEAETEPAPEPSPPPAREPVPRHPVADKVPAAAPAAWVAIPALRGPAPKRPRPAPPPPPRVRVPRHPMADRVPAAAATAWLAVSTLRGPAPRRPRPLPAPAADAPPSRPARRPRDEVAELLMPAAAPGMWRATTAMLSPPPRRRPPSAGKPGKNTDPDFVATVPDLQIKVSAATLVPAAAAPAWVLPIALGGPPPRAARPAPKAESPDAAPGSESVAAAQPETPPTSEEAVLASLAAADPSSIEEIVLSTAPPTPEPEVPSQPEVPPQPEVPSQPEVPPQPAAQPASEAPPARSVSPEAATDRVPAAEKDDAAENRRARPRFDDVDDDADLPEEFLPQARRVPKTWLRWGLAGVALLVLGLVGVHVQRGELMRDPSTAEWLGGIYESLGLNAYPAWAPRQLAIDSSAAEADSRGRLIVTTTFTNRAGFGQPFPILRVTLTDRWDEPLSRQDFAPVEYLGRDTATARIAAGQQVQGRVSMVAAVPDAVGFNLDLCLDRGDGGLVCATDDP